MKRWIHMLLLFPLLWLQGCEDEELLTGREKGIVLTVRCEESIVTKAEKDGERAFNENLIKSVDFLFYRGENPTADQDAIFHVRKELSDDPMQDGFWWVNFSMVLKRNQFERIFPSAGSKATVYALVNFDSSFIGESLSGTSWQTLSAKRLETDFAANEVNYIQPDFLMDGRAVIEYDGNTDQSVKGEIPVSRFAAKLTMGVNVAPQVVLKHSVVAGETVAAADETWEPVLHTMRIYLVDGVKTVLIGGRDDSDSNEKYFNYKNDENKRPFVKENGTDWVGSTVIGEGDEAKSYHETFPMYSYPRIWTKTVSYEGVKYENSKVLPPEQPYFKLEMDWRRVADEHYSYDRRKYYYKIYLPFESFERNNWYAFYLDVAILGSETDEGKADIQPTCYILNWQNRSVINKAAVISKARYLSVDRNSVPLRNMNEVKIPFISSHNVKIVPGSVKATRPFYGTVSSSADYSQKKVYNDNLHAWVLKYPNEDKYYLDYTEQPASAGGAESDYEPANWVDCSPTTVDFKHILNNDYTDVGFDYSPYTITFQVVHDDLEKGTDLFDQYVKEITITQYPAIYIEATRNRDEWIHATGNQYIPYSYSGTVYENLDPVRQQPWGYVFIDGSRYIRVDKKQSGSADPFYTLHSDDNKREYQWRTVWYTGGSRDLFKINVTVLPQDSKLFIGDPRTTTPQDLHYSFTKTPGTENADAWLPDRDGFCYATPVGGGPMRRLQNYYPTDKTERTRDMLAPSYRIASKFGGTEYGQGFFGDIKQEYAEYRCAAYQEDGFPAGRWRLPTQGEILFIAQLSAKGAFEPLFSKGSTYWSANGAVNVGQGTVTPVSNGTALLRCVYDAWYWGDDQYDPMTFLWGDE